jgi:hypothetical protein
MGFRDNNLSGVVASSIPVIGVYKTRKGDTAGEAASVKTRRFYLMQGRAVSFSMHPFVALQLPVNVVRHAFAARRPLLKLPEWSPLLSQLVSLAK